MTKRHAWLLLMFVTGFCSMVYELAMAQLLAGIMGNVLARFATTLGVYVFGLGLGSILFESKDEERDGKLFFKAELALFFVGLASPFLFVGIHHLAGGQPTIVLLATHAIIFVTGFLSGFELPILASLADREGSKGDASALSADYFGMFAASLAFPLLFFPYFGLGAAFWLATFLNLLAAVATYFLIGGRSKTLFAAMATLLVVNATAIAASNAIHQWLSQVYAPVG